MRNSAYLPNLPVMREAVFLKQNQQRWKEFENILNETDANADQLAELYVQITDDLAYSKTFFPESKSTAYLNSLALKIYNALYKNKKEKRNRLYTFWLYELPEVMYRLRIQMLFALVVFSVAIAIGSLSALNDDSFVRMILGDRYVDMTLENIKNGTPMDVYGRNQEFNMFAAIAFNNIRVSFYAFILGLMWGFGSLYIMFENGVMLGSFHTLFFQYGVLKTSLLAVWIHGTLEITAIIVAGGAGFALGGSLLFPKTYTRLQALQRAARDGVKVIIGLIPVFLTAAFFESYATRHYGLSPWFCLSFILPSIAFVIYYFVIYPYRLHHKQLS